MAETYIILEEQGLRDGLQTLPTTISVEQKLEYIDWLIDAGISRIQVASFVHPKLVPQMADADILCKQLPKNNEVLFSALVLNAKGVERAIASGIKHLAVSLSASDTHSRKNANKSIPEAKAAFRVMVSLAKDAGILIRGGIQCAFGCRYEGAISEAVVYELLQHHIDSGVEEIALADSTGMGNPEQMKRILTKAKEICGNTPIAMHLHNTENKGYANMLAAIEVGINQFDTAFGGLGGCPFIKGATGNIATEDSVHMLNQMGYTTGIDISKVARVSKHMQEHTKADLPGLLYKLIDRTDIQMN